MGLRLELDSTNTIVRLSFKGAVTDHALLAGYAALRNSASYGVCHCIVDYTGATKIELSNEAIRLVANKPPTVPPDCIQVNVTPQDLMFGLARMFQILTSETRPNFRVVRTMDEALDLIGVKSPVFSPIDADLSESA
jgi:hypothetical protein